MWNRILAVPLLGLLGVGGCGLGSSGSGDPPTRPARFLGFYHFVRFGGLVGTPTYHAAAQWGTAIGDGAGTLFYGALGTDDAGVSSVEPPSSVSYTLDNTGTFEVDTPWVSGRGGISADDRLLVFGGVPFSVPPPVLVPSPVAPSLSLLLRKGTGLSATSIDGSFHLAELRYDIAAKQLSSNVGSSTFDRVLGKVSTSVTLRNRGGFLEGPFDPFLAAFTVASDGTLAIPAIESGGMLAGGDFAAIAGLLGGGAPQLSLFVRKAVSATALTLVGRYDIVGVVAANAEPGVWHAQGLVAILNADGVGGFTVSGLLNLEGVPVPGATSSGTYSVGADGTLELRTTGGPVFSGGVSASGGIAVLGGGTASGDSPGLFVLSRR